MTATDLHSTPPKNQFSFRSLSATIPPYDQVRGWDANSQIAGGD